MCRLEADGIVEFGWSWPGRKQEDAVVAEKVVDSLDEGVAEISELSMDRHIFEEYQPPCAVLLCT